ncbi:MAG: hypothetical protein LAP40_26695 [Acidobacteriia bacterium]|nr:hypothetical protein [Terriglobia bacterium]
MNAEAEYIREAIGREEYRKALAQWNDYAKHLRQAIEAGMLSAGQREEARALMEWSRRTLLGARAHLRARYHELEVAAAYKGHPAAQSGHIETRL